MNYLSEARPTSSRSSTSRASPASGREFFWRGGVSPPARSRMRSRFRRRAISRNRKAPTSAPGGALSPVISHSRSTGSSASDHPLPPYNRSPARRPAHAPVPTPNLGGLPHTKYNRSARSASTDPRIKLSRRGKHDELVFMMMAVTSDHAPAEKAPWSRTRSALPAERPPSEEVCLALSFPRFLTHVLRELVEGDLFVDSACRRRGISSWTPRAPWQGDGGPNGCGRWRQQR